MLGLWQDRNKAKKAKCVYGCPRVPDTCNFTLMCACWKQLDQKIIN